MWKNKDIPDEDKLKDKIYEAAEMDVLSERLRDGNLEKISNYWKPRYYD